MMRVAELTNGSAYTFDADWDDDILIVIESEPGLLETELTYFLLSDDADLRTGPVTYNWKNRQKWNIQQQNINLVGTSPWQ